MATIMTGIDKKKSNNDDEIKRKNSNNNNKKNNPNNNNKGGVALLATVKKEEQEDMDNKKKYDVSSSSSGAGALLLLENGGADNNNNNNNNNNISSEDEEEEEESGREWRRKDEYMSRGDVLKRRCKRLKKLSKIYRDFYWCLVEELNLKHRHYLWHFGDRNNNENNTGNSNNNNSGGGVGVGGSNSCCEVHSCKKKAMSLTRFCHTHILSDATQVLYKGCTYPTKSSPSGPTLCMKPIIKSAVPSLCSNHLEKAEKHLNRCLRKEGFIGFGSNKHALKFNVVVAEFVRQIQSNRRENL